MSIYELIRRRLQRDPDGPEFEATLMYGAAMPALARLATPAAVAAIKLAARDFDPSVRLAAVRALRRLPVDDEIKALLDERAKDPSEFVAKEARG